MSRICIPNIKRLKFTALFLLSPLFFFAQTLTGLWTGALSNDSSTIRKDQSFEIALTEYRGKVYGYSRSEFIVNDTLYYILKRVKGTIEGDLCEVTDADIISYNFRGKLDKGVKVTSTFRRNQTDSTWYLDGTWKTSATRKYYAVTGKVGLQEEKDLNASKLFPHLEELNLANTVTFYKERKEEPVIVKVAHPEKIKTEYNDRPQPSLNGNDIVVTPVKPNLQKVEAGPVPVSSIETKDDTVKAESQVNFHTEKIPVTDLPKTEIKNIPASTVSVTPAPVIKSIAEVKKPDQPPVKQPEIIEKKEARPVAQVKPVPAAKPIVKQEQPVVKNQAPIKQADVSEKKPDTKTVAVVNNPVTEKKEEQPVKKPLADVTVKAAVIEGRKSEFTQVVNFSADSLELSLYDNGEIDGDTVSVFMNGEVLLSRQGLKASAIKKTIYITPSNEDFTLVLFADNLGKYPPNTGLLVVHDGEDVYNLRFSSDFQKSSGIVFRKKK